MSLGPEQFRSIKRMLKEARELIGDARGIFGSVVPTEPADLDAAERLRDIVRAITNEIDYVDQFLAGHSAP